MKLKTRFTLIFSILFAIFSLLALVAFSHYRKSIQDLVAQQQFLMISTLADEIDNKLLAAQQDLIAITKVIPPDIMQNPEKAQAFLDSRPILHTIFDNNVLLFTPSGKIFVESPYIPGRRGFDLSYREFISHTLKTEKSYISDPYLSTKPPKHPVIIITVPLFDGKGKMTGILGGSIDLMKDNFLGRISTVKIGKTGYLVLTATDRTLIIHPEKKRILTKQAPGLNMLHDKAIEGFEGSGETITSYGTKMLASYKRLKSKNWILIANYPQAEAYRPVQVAERFFLIIFIIGTLAAFFIISVIIEYFIKPLELFTRHVEDIPQKSGDDRFLNIKTKDEIGTLALAFDKMMTEIDRRSELERSEIRLRTLLKTIPDMIWLKDRDGVYLSCNKMFESFFGAKEADIAGKTDYDFIDRELSNSFHESDYKVMTTGKPVSNEKWLTFAEDGYRGLFETTKAPMHDDKGKLIGVFGIAHDITSRKSAEEALANENLKNETFLRAASDGIHILDLDGNVVQVNDAFCRMLGYTPDEMKNMNVAQWDTQWSAQELKKRIACLVKTQKVFETRHRRSDRQIIDVEVNGVGVEIDGKPMLFASARDITQRRKADEEIRKAKNEWEETFDSMSELIMILDTNHKIIRTNKAMSEKLGLTSLETEGITCYTHIHGTKEPPSICPYSMLLSDGQEHSAEVYEEHLGGYYLVTVTPLHNSDGELAGAVHIARDITERKKAEEVLKISEAKFKSMVETLPVAIYLSIGREQAGEYLNSTFIKLFGYTMKDIPSASEWWPLAYPDETYRKQLSEEWTSRVKRSIDTQAPMEPMETVVTCKDGSEKNILWGYIPVGDKNYAYGLDLTERKLAEEKIKQLVNEQKVILNTLTLCVIYLKERKVIWANNAFKTVFGYSKSESEGLDVRHLYTSIQDYERAGREGYARIATGESYSFEGLSLKKDGSTFWTSTTGRAINPDYPTEGSIWAIEDITERKKAEEEIKQSLREKEALLREIHHRVKNNMAVVSSFLSLQAKKIKDPTVRSLFEESEQRVKSMALVHEKLYQTKDLTAINFKDYIKLIVSEIINLYRIDTSKIATELNIEGIDLDLETAVPCGLIINELLTNAFKYAFPDNRSGILRIDFTRTEDTYRLVIKDNGVGLPEEFDFKETKTLGLRIVAVLTKQLMGTLEVKSDNGTEAVVTFKKEKN